MAPDILVRKLLYVRQLLVDLEPYREASLAQVKNEHYKVERLLEMLVVAASDLLNHLLAERGMVADSYRETFRLAAEHSMLPPDLAERLQKAASMRNILVHMYETIDYTILHESIPQALDDFAQFAAIFEERADES